MGRLTFVTRNSEGEENEVIVRDVDMPEFALLRVKIVKEKYLVEDVPDDEEIIDTLEDDNSEDINEETPAENSEDVSNDDDIENVAEEQEIKIEE